MRSFNLIVISVFVCLANYLSAKDADELPMYHGAEYMAEFRLYLDQTPAVNLNFSSEIMLSDDSFLNFENLKLVSEKNSGSSGGGVYRDKDGAIWFLKSTKQAEYEFLGSVMINLLFGDKTAKVKLVKNNDQNSVASKNYVASKKLLGFIPEISLIGSEVIYGDGALAVALDWIGITDRHKENMGYILTQKGLEATRIDYDASFSFFEEHSVMDRDDFLHDLDEDYLFELIARYSIEDCLFMFKTIRDLPDDIVLKLFKRSLDVLQENNYKKLNSKKMDAMLAGLIARKKKMENLLQLLENDPKYQKFSEVLHNGKEAEVGDLVLSKDFMNDLFLRLITKMRFKESTAARMINFVDLKDNQKALKILSNFMERINERCASWMIKAGSLVGSNDEGLRMLHVATVNLKLVLVNLLLEHGVDPNKVDYDLLTFAVHVYSVEPGILKSLLAYSANPNANDHSALRRAIEINSLSAVELLVAAGARDDEAVQIARNHGYDEIANLIEKSEKISTKSLE